MRRRARENPVSFFSFQDIMVCTIGVTILATLLLILQIGTEAAAAIDRLREREPESTEAIGLAALNAEAAALRRRLATLEAIEQADPNAELARQRLELRALDLELRRLREETADAEDLLAAVLRSAALDATRAIAEERLRRRDELAEARALVERRQRITYLLAAGEAHPPTVAEISGGRIVLSFDQAREAPIAFAIDDPTRAAETLLALFKARSDWPDRTLLVVLKPSGVAVHAALADLVANDPRHFGVVLGLDLIAESQWTSDAFPPPRDGRP